MAKRRRLNRDLVIAKAVELADSASSLEAVSLTALAKALQIRTPSLYNHIANQEDLYHGMTVFGLQALLAELREATAGLVGREALEAIAHTYRRFARTHPGIYPLTTRAPEPDNEVQTRLAQELVQLLRLVLASLNIQGDEAIHAIRGFRAVLHGFTSLETTRGFEMPIDRDVSFRRLVTTYLDGLARRPDLPDQSAPA